MTDVPVFNIEINDDAFTAFKRKFDEYQKQIDGTIPLWSKTAEQVKLLTADYKVLQKHSADQKSSAKDVSKFADMAAMSASMMGDVFLATVRSSKSFASGIAASTLHLAKWSALTGLFSSLIGAGGLYGINRLASGVASRRTSALGLGITYGESASFDVAFNPLGDTQAFLAGTNAALTDVTKMVPFAALGLGQKVQGMDAADAFAEALPEIKKLVDKTPERALAQIEQSFHLDDLGFDRQTLVRLRRTDAATVAAMVETYRQQKDPFGIPAETQRAWTNLTVQLDRSGNEIETALERDLVNITPGMTKLSQSFVKFIDALVEDKSGTVGKLLKEAGEGIEDFAHRIGSGSSIAALRDFVDKFKLAKADFDAINGWFERNAGTLGTVLAAAGGAWVGGRFGPLGAVIGAEAAVLPGAVGRLGGDIDRAMVSDAKRGAPHMYGGTPLAGGGVDPKNRGKVDIKPADRMPGGGAYTGAYGGGSSPNRVKFGHPHGGGDVIKLPDVDVHGAHNDRSHFGRRPSAAEHHAARSVGPVYGQGPLSPSNHPGRYEGHIHVGNEVFDYASGGRGAGSSPPGDHPITGYDPSALHGRGAFRTTDVFDPKLGRTRGAVEIHKSYAQDVHHVVTHGCFGIPQSEWPDAEASIKRKLNEYGGRATLRVGADGEAYVVPPGGSPQKVTGRNRPGRHQHEARHLEGPKRPTQMAMAQRGNPESHPHNVGRKAQPRVLVRDETGGSVRIT